MLYSSQKEGWMRGNVTARTVEIQGMTYDGPVQLYATTVTLSICKKVGAYLISL